MKKKMIMSLLLGLLCSVSIVLASSSYLYDVKSGKITYEIKGSGKAMGSTIQTNGKKRLIFDDYGAKNLTEKIKIQKQTIMGRTNIIKTHELVYLTKKAAYLVDFDAKEIQYREDMGMASYLGDGQNLEKFSENIIKKMGGKKVGTDEVAGHRCDIWEIKGVKQCLYKGVPLKIETSMMGITLTEIATKAEFDISLSEENFKLPDFPLYDMEGNPIEKK